MRLPVPVKNLRRWLLSGSMLVATAMVVPIAVAPTPASAAVTSLPAALDSVLGDARLVGATVGVQVRDATSGEVLYARNADQRVIPASNDKLLTSTAALEVLGTDYRFHTRVLSTGQRRAGLLRGNLYLKGGGDPTTLAADYDGLAKQIADGGVRVIAGDLVGDDTWFDSERLGNDWAWDDEPEYYADQISGLTLAPDTDYDAGSIIVQAKGAAVGQRATLSLTPPTSVVQLDNRTTTGAIGSASTISATREHGTDTIVVTGSIAADAVSAKNWVSVWSPTVYATSVFRDALTRHGIRVLGHTTYAATPAGARQLADHPSMTLGELLIPFLKLSNNNHAEVLMKAMGRQTSGAGTWAAGLQATATAVAGLGVDATKVRTVDGSGLSRQDLVTNQQLTSLLIAARGKAWYQTWYNALPIAGIADRLVGGTLRSRMAGTPAAGNLHGKTGTLTGVNALSGYVTDAAGRQLVFSAVVNNNLVSVTPVLDAVGVILASATATGVPSTAALTAPVTPSRERTDVECSWVKAC
jgi:D-alanyl-D-alanine carboxypeptidase/D-alanyl-D-alanine-endopeptidase (penicillin-binding protein 4)